MNQLDKEVNMKIRSFILYSFMFMSLFFLITQTVSYAETEQTYEVGTSHLNVRSAPSHDAPVVAHLQKGEQVKVFKEKNGWFQTYYGGDVVWVASQFLIPVKTTEENTSSQNTEDVLVTASSVNIRSGPSTNDAIIGSATLGDTYRLIETSGDWVKVALTNGTGWMAAHLTDQDVTDHQTEGAVKDAVNQPVDGSLDGYTIVLDPGHGGKDSGAVGFNGIYEKDLIDPMTEKVAQHLQDAGADVIFTRKGDSYISLDQRIRLSHVHDTDAFVSIHFNSFPVPIVKGTSTFYYAGGEDKNLAKCIQNSLTELDSVYDRGIRQGDYKVLRDNKDLAILIELGFITNPEELETIKTATFQNEAAKAITNGFINYFQRR